MALESPASCWHVPHPWCCSTHLPWSLSHQDTCPHHPPSCQPLIATSGWGPPAQMGSRVSTAASHLSQIKISSWWHLGVGGDRAELLTLHRQLPPRCQACRHPAASQSVSHSRPCRTPLLPSRFIGRPRVTAVTRPTWLAWEWEGGGGDCSPSTPSLAESAQLMTPVPRCGRGAGPRPSVPCLERGDGAARPPWGSSDLPTGGRWQRRLRAGARPWPWVPPWRARLRGAIRGLAAPPAVTRPGQGQTAPSAQASPEGPKRMSPPR